MQVNRIFAQNIVSEVNTGDLVWIHDYHLMLLPTMLSNEAKARGKNIKIGFFLHTPFPTADMLRAVPVWRDLLQGLQGSHVLGFHTASYAENFKDAYMKML